MGTNFYVDAPPTCNNPLHNETLHIGKRSGGWKFGFHAIPERGLTSWKAWQQFLADKEIRSEYGEVMSLVTFAEDVVEQCQSEPWGPLGKEPICRIEYLGDSRDREREYHDADGYDFHEGDFS